MHYGVIFGGCLDLEGHFLGDFGVLGSSFDVFGALGGLGGQTLSVPRLGWATFGSILGPFLEPKGDIFKVIFWIDFWITFLSIFS